MIDCDIHQEIANLDQFLEFVDPGQREWFKAQGAGLGLPGYNWSHPSSWFRQDLEHEKGAPPGGDAQAVVRDVLDPLGVDVGVLNADDALYVSLMSSPYRAAALARAHNDWTRDVWLGADSRLRASLICAAQDPQAAAAEIRRVAADGRFVAVLLSGGSERPYGEPRYLPVFEAAVECGMPVAIHSGGEGMGIAGGSGGAGAPSFYIEWHTLGSACSIMSHLVSLVVHGTFERLPELRVLLMEGGLGWLPGILWRLDTNWRGLRADTPWLRRKPSEVVREHIRFTTQPLEHTDGQDRLFMDMLAAAGAPDILCFASDYPHWDFDDPKQLLGRLPEEWRTKVSHDNAEALFGKRLAPVGA